MIDKQIKSVNDIKKYVFTYNKGTYKQLTDLTNKAIDEFNKAKEKQEKKETKQINNQ